MNKINIPNGAQEIIRLLEHHHFDAYIVGGCVRDSLLGLTPHDWDICTSAKPEELLDIFGNKFKTIETGLRHGTVTVCIPDIGEQYEVTTFRIDGEYSDNRHPDSVIFTSILHEDLSRRDFTINAMAYNNFSGLIDPFGGEKSLINGEIECVGNPSDRFKEDALRIMRALRFASVYGFSIESWTVREIHRFAPTLVNISAERIQSELCKLLLGKNALQVFLWYPDVFATIIPEIRPCIGFNQKNRYHKYTVYEHIVRAVCNYTGDDISVKLALLFHDIGKPKCFTEDKNGGHFHGHGKTSHDIAKIVLKRLRFDNKTVDEVLDLVLYHDAVIEPNHKIVRRWLNRVGEDKFRKLLEVRMADIKSHADDVQEDGIENCMAVYDILDDVIKQEQCFSLKDLAITGKDVKSLGVPEGKMIGDILNRVLNMVIDGELQNEKDQLMEEARKYYSHNKPCLKFDATIKPAVDGINDRLVYKFTSDDNSIVKRQEYSYDSKGIYRCDSTTDDGHFGCFMVDKNKPVSENIKEVKSLVYALHYEACKIATEYDLYSNSAKYNIIAAGLSDPDVFNKYIKSIIKYLFDEWIDEYIKESDGGEY